MIEMINSPKFYIRIIILEYTVYMVLLLCLFIFVNI